ncbi:MAG: hypothetical protein FJ206_07375 [Gemmatimonadetes bacterium]|nr:hypothetical protein [Gemmatimonadota bacterium]
MLAVVGGFSLVASAARAQTSTDSTTADSLRIAAVVVKASDVFPPGESRGLIAKIANGLHITTRPGVIRRELLLRPGDRFDSAKAAETERNLRALRVFRRARVDTVRSDSGLVLQVSTQDAFTTRIEGSIEGSTRSSNRWIGITETNLFGTATRVAVRYRQTSDRDGITTTFQRDRLIDGRIGLTAFYDRTTDGRLHYAAVALPYQSFSSRSAWYLSGEERQGRVLRFRQGGNLITDSLSRRFWMGRAGIGGAVWGNPSGYLRWGVDGQVRRDDYADRARPDTIGRTVTGAVTGYLQWRTARFRISSNLQGFGRDEDVDLSTVVRVGLGITPSGFGYQEDGVVPQIAVQTGFGWRGGFLNLAGSALGRVTEAGAVDSGSVHLGGLLVLQPSTHQMLAMHAAHGWQKNPMPSAEFDFGPGLGPRGLDPHEFTGDRAFLLAGEYRYMVTDNFLGSAGLALAGFGDYGGAWFSGSARRTGYAVGVGVRFGLTVTTDLSPARLDFAYIGGTGVEPGWRIAIGKGFVFNSSLRLDR